MAGKKSPARAKKASARPRDAAKRSTGKKQVRLKHKVAALRGPRAAGGLRAAAGPRAAGGPRAAAGPRAAGGAGARAAGISDEAVRKATGKTWAEWFAILDAAGAARMDHQGIVKVLVGQHGVGPWWQQMVAVNFERARGLRQTHERPDGYQISRSKTFEVPVDRVYRLCSDEVERARWLPEGPLVIRKETPNRSMRITWVDGRTNLELMFYPKAGDKTELTVQHSKLPDARQAERMKGFWEQRLEALEQLLGE